MPKATKIRSAALNDRRRQIRHSPLGQTIQDDEDRDKFAVLRNRRKDKFVRKKAAEDRDDDDDEEELGGSSTGVWLDERTSRQILKLGKEQQMEMEAEEDHEEERRRSSIQKRQNQKRQQQQKQQKPRDRRHSQQDDDDDDDDDDDESIAEEEHSVLQEEDHDDEDNHDDDDAYVQQDAGYVTVVEGTEGLSPEEEAVVASMMGSRGAEERRTLADIILEKIHQKEAERNGEIPDDDEEQRGETLPPKVIEVYTDIGKILSRYTSGKLPKAFKVIPSLSNWEEVLYLTRPDLWTPQAMFAATRIFASNLNPRMAQRFYNLVLLDSVRADIATNKKLNYHYYMSLKKAVYKPAAFFKGILLPLCRENGTLREAAIVASVLQRVSIPVHHSAVAVHKLAQLDYGGAASIFIKTLLNKKYSLPSPVVGSLVQHFTGFLRDDRILPVLWHQSLLVFVQRYKNELKGTAREPLRDVMKKHFHPKITPEIRRELFGAQAWKEERSHTDGGSHGRSGEKMDL